MSQWFCVFSVPCELLATDNLEYKGCDGIVVVTDKLLDEKFPGKLEGIKKILQNVASVSFKI